VQCGFSFGVVRQILQKIEYINHASAIIQTENNTTNIDIKKLKPGNYLLKAKSNAGVETGKFIKQ